MGGLFLGNDSAVHGTIAQSPIRMGIEVNQQPLGAASEVEQGGAPGASVLG